MPFFPTPILYNGPLNFRTDLNGANPAGWTIVVEVNADDIQVLAEMGNHKKVLQIDYSGGAGNNGIQYDFAAGHATGTVEFWMRTTNRTPPNAVFIMDGAFIHSVYFGIASNNWFYASDAQPAGAIICAAANDIWYHTRVQYDCAADSWTVWINGTQYGPYDFFGAPVAMDALYFWGAADNSADRICYVDSVDFSWRYGYFTNRNRTEFLNKIDGYMSKPILRALADVV